MDGGAAIIYALTKGVPGLFGLLRLTRDSRGQIHLDIGKISINNDEPQLVLRLLGKDSYLMDSAGNELSVQVVDVAGRSALVEYHASQRGGSPQPESAGTKALRPLGTGPKAKADLSRSLRHEEVTGQLNKVVRQLLAEGVIEYTVPDKPPSCLQKYRVTAKGMDAIGTLNEGSIEP